MQPLSELDAIRQRAILSSLAGFPFLLVFGVVWIAAGALSYVLIGMPGMPVAMVLESGQGR